MNGWIKLHRCLINKPIWAAAQPEQKVVLITILMLASHEPKEWIWQGKKFTIQPGQFITSLDSLAKKSGVSKKSVRTALANFENLEFLANVSAKTGRLISVINWELYQSKEDEPANIAAKHRQSTGKAPAPIKNYKNKRTKEDKNIYGEFRNVFLTDDEYARLKTEIPLLADSAIEFLSGYIEEKGYKSKSHYLAIKRWVIDAISKKQKTVDFSAYV